MTAVVTFVSLLKREPELAFDTPLRPARKISKMTNCIYEEIIEADVTRLMTFAATLSLRRAAGRCSDDLEIA